MGNNGTFSLSINEDHEDAVEKEEIDGDEQSEKVIFIGLGLVDAGNELRTISVSFEIGSSVVHDLWKNGCNSRRTDHYLEFCVITETAV